jgi:hypothetical protein
MAFDLVETIKLIMGLSGLASGTYLIYDRIICFRPTVSFRPHDNAVNLVIRNAMPESLIVDSVTITPPYLCVHSRRDLGETLTKIKAGVEARGKDAHTSHDFLIIDPLTEKLFPLIWVVSKDNLSPRASIKVRCLWRSTGRPLKRGVTASATVQDILQMQKEAQVTNIVLE